MERSELQKIRERMLAAKRVDLFFKEKLNVQAANNPFRLKRSLSEDILGGARLVNEMKGNVTYASIFDLTAKCRLGNCRELNSMVYMLLKSQQIIYSKHHYVHLVLTMNFDHVFAVICDKKFLPGIFKIDYLGKTCVIVDKWTNDYYAPNISFLSQVKYHLNTLPNPYQLYIRRKIISDQLKASEKIPDM
ncbi:hypothetical protein [Citrobacter cronae]|uniref:hypothetical protein n=1 Tax=Citrobacter cronae TaxID=1748967 RepID=UPI001C0FEEEA|nr:hypothetical protein [Citrobacter cronae]MBU5388645.1 hypothetical protein [Citrobacter cronae]